MTRERGKTITFVGCDDTPPEFRHRIGYVIDWWTPQPHELRPAPGFQGTLMGIPGVFLDEEHFEIRYVDMRTDEQKWLDEADELLREPLPGEVLEMIARRHARAQWLILRAQFRATRRML
jgi:hypothetical protein